MLNGFLMLFVSIAMTLLSLAGIVYGIMVLDAGGSGWLLVGSILLLIVSIVFYCGFLMLEPNEAKVTTWFGKYSGTFAQTGYFWINPFYSTKRCRYVHATWMPSLSR